MKERPKRKIVSAFSKRDEYNYYDSVSVHRKTEEEKTQKQRPKRQSSQARSFGAPNESNKPLPQQVKNLEVRLERLNDAPGMGYTQKKRAVTKDRTVQINEPDMREDLILKKRKTDSTPFPAEESEELNVGQEKRILDSERGIDVPRVKSETSKNTFQCPSCSNSYTELRYLEFHSKVHAKQLKQKVEQISKFTCLQKSCFKQCVTYEDLMLHMRHDHPETSESSRSLEKSGTVEDLGGISAQPKTFFYSKVIDKTTGFESFKCSTCQALFSFKSDLTSHIKQHRNGGGVLSCTTCEKTFSDLDTLRTHMRRHETQKLFKCPDCPRKLASMESLKVHARFHNSEHLYSCQECSQSFPSNSSLLNHRVKNHNSNLPFKCRHCTLYFQSLRGLQQHEKLHLEYMVRSDLVPTPKKLLIQNGLHEDQSFLNMEDENFVNEDDGASTSEAVPYSEKSQTVIGRVHKCTKIPLPRLLSDSIVPGATSDNNLCIRRQAVNSSHSDDGTSTNTGPSIQISTQEETLFSCNQCDMTFRLYTSYVRHCQLIHSIKMNSEFVYEPEVRWQDNNTPIKCMKRVKSAEEIERDSLKVHECPYCSKRMSRKDALRIHINSHTGEKPYRCQFCEMSFGNPANLYRHKQHYCPVKRSAVPTSTLGCGEVDSDFPGVQSLSINSNMHILTPDEELSRGSSSGGSTGTTLLRSEEEANIDQSSSVITKPALESRSQFGTESAGDTASLNVVNNNTEYECTMCQEKIFGYRDIIQHMHEHSSSDTDTDTFMCNLCNKTFSSKSALGIHFLVHLGITFTCPASNCEEKFTTKQILQEHLKTHTDRLPFLCPKCGKDFPTSPILAAHKKQYSDSSCIVGVKLTLLPSAEISDDSSTTKHSSHQESVPDLRNHIQHKVPVSNVAIMPATTGFYPCEYCNKIFGSLAGLSRHFKAEHSDIFEREGRSEGTADETWTCEGEGLFPTNSKEQEIEVIDLGSDTEDLSTASATQLAENVDDDEGDDEFEGDEDN